jgi:hypothetical protein
LDGYRDVLVCVPAAAMPTLLQEVLRIPVEYRMRGHLTEEKIERYAAGRVSLAPELDRLTRHLKCCEQCSEAAERAANLISAVRTFLRVQRHKYN